MNGLRNSQPRSAHLDAWQRRADHECKPTIRLASGRKQEIVLNFYCMATTLEGTVTPATHHSAVQQYLRHRFPNRNEPSQRAESPRCSHLPPTRAPAPCHPFKPLAAPLPTTPTQLFPPPSTPTHSIQPLSIHPPSIRPHLSTLHPRPSIKSAKNGHT